jgi:L-asparaginase II
MPQDADLVELARVWRGPVVESLHHGVIAAADAGGTYRHIRGDSSWVTTPRSALKPFQAVALVESGAADALGLTDEHIALACASHHAQPFQVALLGDWLAKLGLTEEALVCGPALPRETADMGAAFAHGGPRRIFNNCSGKHCGFLSVAKHMGAGLDYARPDHPAQRLYLDILSDFAGVDAAAMPAGVDGCGLPAIALPIRVMARAVARLGVGQTANPARRAAAHRVMNAMAAHPDHLAAKDHATARIIRATGGGCIVKGGAEGYLAAFLRERAMGVVIKVADGDPAGRVKYAVLARALARLGSLTPAASEALIAAVAPPITDSNGQPAGQVDVTYDGEATTPTKATLGFWLSGTPIEDWADFLAPLDKYR